MIRPLLVTILAATPLAALAAGSARDAVLAHYSEQASRAEANFAGFAAARGETLFRTRWAGGDERTPSCTSCHTDDPKAQGRNAKTGRPIDPMAVSVNPERFTDLDKVEKQFSRDCKSVLGRECTAMEKGDYITFMTEQ